MRRHEAYRQKLRPAASDRKVWVKLVEAARTIAARASGDTFGLGADRAPSTAALVLDLNHMLRGVKAMDFPLAEASAVELADCLLHGLKAFAKAGTPERREMCASVLKASAGAIMDMLEDLRADDAARTWKRQLPESEW